MGVERPLDEVVIITGASRGIGAAAADRFLQGGWRVIGTSTTNKKAAKHERLTMLQLDLRNEESIASCIALLETHNIKPKVLINNAGVNPGPDDEYLSMTALRQTVEVNLLGLISLTEKLLPSMLPDGRVINLTSSASDVNNAIRYIESRRESIHAQSCQAV